MTVCVMWSKNLGMGLFGIICSTVILEKGILHYDSMPIDFTSVWVPYDSRPQDRFIVTWLFYVFWYAFVWPIL
jgi:hypothetical protein